MTLDKILIDTGWKQSPTGKEAESCRETGCDQPAVWYHPAVAQLCLLHARSFAWAEVARRKKRNAEFKPGQRVKLGDQIGLICDVEIGDFLEAVYMDCYIEFEDGGCGWVPVNALEIVPDVSPGGKRRR